MKNPELLSVWRSAGLNRLGGNRRYEGVGSPLRGWKTGTWRYPSHGVRWGTRKDDRLASAFTFDSRLTATATLRVVPGRIHLHPN